MQKLTIMAIDAGGGHKAAMYSLGRSLDQYAPEVKYDYFLSEYQAIDSTHLILTYWFPLFYEIGFYISDLPIFQRGLKLFLRKSINSIAQEMIDKQVISPTGVYISTHFLQTLAMLRLKATDYPDIQVVAYVPDFDNSLMHYPTYRGKTADYVIAQGQGMIDKLIKRGRLGPENCCRGGFLPTEYFSQARQQSTSTAKEAVANTLELDPDAVNKSQVITFVAGTYWIRKSLGVIKRLVKIADKWQRPTIIFVICGKSEESYAKVAQLQELCPTNLQLVPVPFLPHEKLAEVFRTTDLSVLFSLAPASFYELLESQAVPVLVHTVNPGQERYTLRYAVSTKAATYQPRTFQLLGVIEGLTQGDAKNQDSFLQAADQEMEASRARAKHMASFLQTVVQS